MNLRRWMPLATVALFGVLMPPAAWAESTDPPATAAVDAEAPATAPSPEGPRLDFPPQAFSKDVVAVLVGDATKITPGIVRDTLAALLKVPAAAETPLKHAEPWHERLLAAGGERAVQVWAIPADAEQPETLTLVSVKPGQDRAALRALLAETVPGDIIHDLGERWLEIAFQPEARRLPDAAGEPEPRLRAALAASGDAPIAVAFVPNPALKQKLAGLLTEAPPAAAEMVRQLMRIEWFAATVRLGKSPTIAFTAHLADEPNAVAFQTQLQGLIVLAAAFLGQMNQGGGGPVGWDVVTRLLQGLRVGVEGSNATLLLNTGQLQDVARWVADFASPGWEAAVAASGDDAEDTATAPATAPSP